MRVSVISAGLGTSRGVKAKRVVPMRKPAGNPACVASQARCAGREEKTLAELGTLRQVGRDARRCEAETAGPAGGARKVFGGKCAPPLLYALRTTPAYVSATLNTAIVTLPRQMPAAGIAR